MRTLIISQTGKKSIVIELPENYNEVTEKALEAIFRVLLVSENPFLGKIEAAKSCLGRHYRTLTAEQIHEICAAFDFLDDFTLTEQKFPRYGIFIGPKSLLEKVTVSEYAAADNYLRKYIKDKKKEDLLRFTACLYRKPRPDLRKFKKSFDYSGDDRTPFNTDKVEEAAKDIRRFPMWLHTATLVMFLGSKAKFLKMFPHIFPKNTKGKAGSWANTKLDLAESSIFGDINKTGEAYIITALAYLNKKAKEVKEQIEAAK